MGAFGDLEITEETLTHPDPELAQFANDINRLNDEKSRTRAGWEIQEQHRMERKYKDAETYRRKIAQEFGGKS